MNADKLKKLRAVGYVINKCCGMCEHSMFEMSTDDYGQCLLLPNGERPPATSYRYGEPSGNFHYKIHVYGSCDLFEPSPLETDPLKETGFDKLLDRRAFTRSNRHKQKTSY